MGEGGGGMDWESSIDIYVQNRSLVGSCLVAQEAQLSAVMTWGEMGVGAGVGGGFTREGMYVYIELIHCVEQQKLASTTL